MSTDDAPLTPAAGMTSQQEFAYYADPANQTHHGTPRRRKEPMGAPVPVRFPAHLLDEVERAAEGAEAVLDQALRRATPTVRDVLHRYPPFPQGRSRGTQVVCELDLALRSS